MAKNEVENPLLEATKEAGRVVVLAGLPVLIISLEKWVFDWRLIAVTGGIAFLRFVDKYLHLKGKKENNEILTKGLTRF